MIKCARYYMRVFNVKPDGGNPSLAHKIIEELASFNLVSSFFCLEGSK